MILVFFSVFSGLPLDPERAPLCLSIGWMAPLLVASSAGQRFRFRSLYAMLILPFSIVVFVACFGLYVRVLCVG